MKYIILQISRKEIPVRDGMVTEVQFLPIIAPNGEPFFGEFPSPSIALQKAKIKFPLLNSALAVEPFDDFQRKQRPSPPVEDGRRYKIQNPIRRANPH
jgi:hypothetical protein